MTAPFLLLFLRDRRGRAFLSRLYPIAGQVEFQDNAVVYQAVDGRYGGHRILEDHFPFREGQIDGDHHTAPLVAFREQCEEHLHLFSALLDIADVCQVVAAMQKGPG